MSKNSKKVNEININSIVDVTFLWGQYCGLFIYFLNHTFIGNPYLSLKIRIKIYIFYTLYLIFYNIPVSYYYKRGVI